MGILNFFKKNRQINDSDELTRYLLEIVNAAASGVNVTAESALRSTPFFSSIKVIAESVAHLPFVLIKKDGDRKVKADDHPLYDLLHDSPNDHQTSCEFRQQMMINAQLHGHAFALVNKVKNEVREIIPLDPGLVTWERKSDLTYAFKLENKVISTDKLFRLSGFTDGLTNNVTLLKSLRDSIGLAIATETFGSKLFANGVRPSGVLTHPGKISNEAQDRMAERIKAATSGDNASGLMLLQEGITYDSMSFTNDEAQYLETRKHQRSEIAGGVGCPPHKIGDMEKASYSNIEHQSLEFVIGSVLPWVTRWEQSVSKWLLTKAQRKQYYGKIIVDGLLRGDTESRMTSYMKAIQYGILSPNEVREKEDLNPRELGEIYYHPANQLEDGTKVESGNGEVVGNEGAEEIEDGEQDT